MNTRDTALTRILIAYANRCGPGSTFSGRTEATAETREQILELFEKEADE